MENLDLEPKNERFGSDDFPFHVRLFFRFQLLICRDTLGCPWKLETI